MPTTLLALALAVVDDALPYAQGIQGEFIEVPGRSQALGVLESAERLLRL